ncbi:hypothetical protein ACFPES_05630 [Paenibacillus sp. GCM10023248]|nr:MULTISPECIES: hypothetical protein [Bacillales]MDD9266512.1 hypothetical protein [Paenibacillus sp. MAHUQ-63]MDR6878640.1 hypothetical protein [Bacillus sp. 3255]
MDISGLTQEQMKEILLKAYKIGQEKESMEVKELIEEIKQQILTVLVK